MLQKKLGKDILVRSKRFVKSTKILFQPKGKIKNFMIG